MCMGKDVGENETFQISSQQKMINNKEVEILGIKIDKKIIISPTYQKHFQKSRPKTKCIIDNFPIP